MMPSRGLQLARGNAPRLYQLQCRQLSSSSKRIPSGRFRSSVQIPFTSSQWQKSTAILPSTTLFARNASSTPAAAAQTLPSTPPTPPEAVPTVTAEQSSFPDMDTISLDGIDLDPISDIPEKIGYLHEIGLDYGWGPTSVLEWIMEHIHIYGGLPWWGSIAATALVMRLTMFPLFLKSSDTMARQTALVSVTKPIQQRMTDARAAGDQAAMMAAMQEYMALRRNAGLSVRNQFAPLILQGILAYCGFKLIRAMVALPVPALQTDGPLWLHDLTLSDPYLILPVMMAGSIHLLVRMGGETGAATQAQLSPAFQNVMLWGMPAIIFVAMGYQSGALCVWFTASGAIGIAQSLLLRNPKARALFGITPLYTPTTTEQQGSGWLNSGSSSDSEKSKPRPFPTPGKREAAYTAPTYQAPNLRRSPQRPSGVIDVKGTSRPQHTQTVASESTAASSQDEDMIQPPTPTSQSVFEKASEGFQNASKGVKSFQKQVQDKVAEYKATKAINEKKKRYDDYEKMAQKRRGKSTSR